MAKTKLPVKAKSRGGRPRHRPTEELRKKVMKLASVLTSHHDIAYLIGLGSEPGGGTKTLLKYYDKELREGKIAAMLLGRSKLFERVSVGDPWAIQMLLKCKDGWVEKSELELTDKRKPPNYGITFPTGGPGQSGARATPAAQGSVDDNDVEVSGEHEDEGGHD